MRAAAFKIADFNAPLIAMLSTADTWRASLNEYFSPSDRYSRPIPFSISIGLIHYNVYSKTHGGI
jgi:hypothetical protein